MRIHGGLSSSIIIFLLAFIYSPDSKANQPISNDILQSLPPEKALITIESFLNRAELTLEEKSGLYIQ